MSELHISYTAITDNELDDKVSDITVALPHCGENSVTGSQGVATSKSFTPSC